MIQTSLSPNTEKDDVFLALKVLLTPWTWGDVSARTKVERLLSDIISIKHVTTVDSGRTALFTILTAAGIGPGDEVILQAYTCVAVPEPVLWVGATPVYVDCTNDLVMDIADLKKKVTHKTKVIIVQHTFGQPAGIQEILDFAHARQIFVIEDCAHALGGEIDERALGSFGDASFFSFGRDKSISSVFGGAIATSSTEFQERISEVVIQYPQPDFSWVAQQLLHPLILAKAKFTYNFLSLGKITLEIAKRLKLISKAIQPTELSGGKPTFAFHQFSPALAQLAYNQLQKLSRFTGHRQSCALEYREALKNVPNISAPDFVPGHAYLRYTITSPRAADYLQKAKTLGIQLGDWYTTPIAPRGVQYEEIGYTPGSCPRAEKLASTSLNLPTHIGITRDMIEEIVRHVFN